MSELNQFNLTTGDYAKIKFKGDKNFKVIGEIIKEDEELNLFRIKFPDIKNKVQTYWFSRFSGNVINKKPTKKDEDKTIYSVDEESPKAYYISVEPVYDFDIIPELDICYQAQIDEDIDEDKNENKTVEVIQ